MWFANSLFLVAAISLCSGPPAESAPRETPRPGVSTATPPEWVIRIVDILTGDPMNPASSPLSLSKSRFGWKWLAARHAIGVGDSIRRDRFRGPKEIFERLDRNGDGVLDASDFDWSDRAPFVQQQAQATALFNRLNTDGDGEVSAQEWRAVFDRFAGFDRGLSAEDLRQALFAGKGGMTVARPQRYQRLLGFLSGELGSFGEGPNPGQPAPDFALRTQDGNRTLHLADFRGRKPVVLVFGSFT